MSRIKPTFTEHLFRPVHEVSMSMTWAAGALLTPLTSLGGYSANTMTLGAGLAAGMVGVSGYYGLKAFPLLKRQMSLHTNRKTFMTAKELRVLNGLHKRKTKKAWKDDPREMYFGNGYRWGSEHAQRAYQVMDLSSDLSEVNIPSLIKPYVARYRKETLDLGGSPWIHGMGDAEKVMVNESSLYGHTFISGNVGSGKTTLLKLLSLNALHMGNVLIVLDPKNDTAWKAAIKSEMEYMGIGHLFYEVHPSNPSKSARFPLLKNYSRISEIADRIAPLMGSGTGGDSFQAFASETIYHICVALDYLNEPIRLTSIQKAVANDRRGLGYRVADKYFTEHIGADWLSKLEALLSKDGPMIFENLANYYVNVMAKDNPCTAMDGMVQLATHDDSHYVKMVVGLRPVLTALTADPFGDLLSPVENINDNDPRPIVDLEKVMTHGGCIYISLDSMSDNTSASYLSRLIMAELAAVAAARYNAEGGVMENLRRVTVANDEVHSSLQNNEALIQLLAMGRAAMMQMILATQTVSDIEAKTDKATADRFLGLCNNFISMRSTDPRTQEYVAKQFNKTSISQSQVQVGSGANTSDSLLDYSVSYGERIMKTRELMMPDELIGELPNLQYVARLADGRRLKMKLDIIIHNDKAGEVAPWAA